jgi:hypothetical protein
MKRERERGEGEEEESVNKHVKNKVSTHIC